MESIADIDARLAALQWLVVQLAATQIRDSGQARPRLEAIEEAAAMRSAEFLLATTDDDPSSEIRQMALALDEALPNLLSALREEVNRQSKSAKKA